MIDLENMEDSTNKLIAIVDDEPDILELVKINLNKAGFVAKTFEDGNSFFRFLKNTKPSLVILDLMLPDTDGLEICKYLKQNEKFSDIPIIMLTAKTEEMDKVLGLEIGADDYITKPFSTRELIARVKVILRRGTTGEKEEILERGMVTINVKKYEVFVNNKLINLTTSEFKILKLLASKPGWVYSREQILEYLNIIEKGVLDRTIDVHIKNLREKLGKAGKMIKNVRGIGYKMEL